MYEQDSVGNQEEEEEYYDNYGLELRINDLTL